MSNHPNSCASCACDSDTTPDSPRQPAFLKRYWRESVSGLLLAIGMSLDYSASAPAFDGWNRLIYYLAAYIPVGWPVILQGIRHLKQGDLFTEFFLMSLATVGAFAIGEYPEGVAVMLFYAVGEAFQGSALRRARNNIRSLLDVRPTTCRVVRPGGTEEREAASIQPGEKIQIRPGERIPLDATLLSDNAALNASALTGESIPMHRNAGEELLAGMINLQGVIEAEVTRTYDHSAIARILELVESAASRKAKTELFIRKFARIYTPAVVALALMVVFLPALWVSEYLFEEWLYRGLVFLVISCPCALVISIPLGYFGGIGAASRNGLLVKGGEVLDALTQIRTVVFDKTGTLTRGEFSVQTIQIVEEYEEETLSLLYAVESGSTHPLAQAVTTHLESRATNPPTISSQNELAGQGITAQSGGRTILVGNASLLQANDVPLCERPDESNGTAIYIAVAGECRGVVTLADELREEAAQAVQELRSLGVTKMAILSGDRLEHVRPLGETLKIDRVYGGLLPEEKAELLGRLVQSETGRVAFVGDGINDAPVLAQSDVGIAMGAMGSDVAVETADLVIQHDHLTGIPTAIRIARATRRIVWQNIALAMGVKLLVMSMGAAGHATLWEAVFADVGVALLAILNAIRIQSMVK